MNTTLVIQDIINAVSLGGLYALAALGIAVIFGVMRLINFAHGELIMVGGYVLWLCQAYPWPAMCAVTLAAVGVLAVLMERVAFRPVRDADPATLLVTSFFVSSIIQNSAILSADSRPKGVSIFPGLLGEVSIGPVLIGKLDAVTIVVAVVLLSGVAWFLSRTLLGLEIRAASENFTMARLLGIRANRVIPGAFLMSGLLAAVVAIILITRTGNVYPTVGLQLVLVGFVATVLGGMGNLYGAVAGGFVLGGMTVALQAGLPTGAAPYRDAFLFSGVIAILIFRPAGIFPSRFAGDRV
jgi:branched-chain amino acid transport system permease protein